jgi:DNA-binding response OmpR family regulator
LSEVKATQPPTRAGHLPERRVVVLERDTIHRFSTERILRREDYWVFVTEEPAAAMRVAAVSAIDLVLVDLGLGVLLPVPPSERRRGDSDFDSLPPALAEGYAILRPLHLDPKAHVPIVTLRLKAPSEETVPPCRFAVVGLLPKDASASGLVEGLGEVFADARSREVIGAARPDDAGRARGASPSRPFESTPAPLRTALVADPDAAARRALVDALVRHGFTVYEAGGGQDALRVAVARRPWLVVTEVQLADEGGLQFCRRVRSHSLLRRTPVVFLSERDDCEIRHQALTAGADDYLVKPAPSREHLVRLELVLRRFTADGPGTGPGAGLRGAIELMGAPAVLQICNLSQLTGVLVARRGSESLRIAFRRGQIVSATGPDHRGAAVVYDFIAWPQGQFEFDRGAHDEGEPMSQDFNALLLEACRRLDERRRGKPPEALQI